MARDAYDPRIVFDDVSHEVLGALPTPAPEERNRDSSAHLRRFIRRRRLRPSVSVELLGYDLTPWSFTVPTTHEEVLGADEMRGLYLFQSLLKNFRRSMPKPRAVRVDGEESYKVFRNERRAPYVSSLNRLSALMHVGGDVADVYDKLADCAAVGGTRVGLDLPLRARKRAVAWQDGPEVLVTICFVSIDGRQRYATSGAPATDHFEEVVTAATEANVPLTLIDPDLAAETAAESVLVGLASAAPTLVRCPSGFVGALDSGQPHIAAAMSLLQHYQRGSKRAQAELTALWQSGNEKMLREAGDILLRAQGTKVAGKRR